MSREAWTRTDCDPVRAQLLEWQAICQAELDYPPAAVRSVFEQAISLDPSAHRITENLDMYNDAAAQIQKSEWHIENVSRFKSQTEAGRPDFELLKVP